MYGTEQMTREVRKLVVSHVTKNWTEFSIMSHDNNVDNYMSSAAEYLADMSQLYTYCGLCELEAAGQLFRYVFEVYRNYQLYVRFKVARCLGCVLRKISLGAIFMSTGLHVIQKY